jgi:hypothetical protein
MGCLLSCTQSARRKFSVSFLYLSSVFGVRDSIVRPVISGNWKKNPKWNKICIFIMKPFSMLLHWTRFLLLLLSPLKALTQSLRHKSGLSSYFYYHFISLITFIKKQNKTKKISLSKSCFQTKSSFKAIILILKREKLQPSSRLLYVMK